MKFTTVNCTNGSYYETEYDCIVTKESSFGVLLGYFSFVLPLAVFGLVTNSISYVIFSSFKQSRFFEFLKTCCSIGLTCNASDVILSISFLSMVKNVYMYNDGMYFDSELYTFILSYLTLYLFSTFYTLEGIYTLYSLYERILMYKAKWPFAKTSPRKIFLISLIYTVIINLPINVSRYYRTYNLKIGKESTEVYLYSSKEFSEYNDLLYNTIFVSGLVRDCIPLIGIVALMVIYLQTVNKFYKFRKTVTDKAKSQKSRYRRSDLEYARILVALSSTTLVSSVLLTIFRISLAFNIQENYSFITYFLQFNGFLTSLRNSVNFVIFYRLNSKFRQQFKSYLPRFLRYKQESNRQSTGIQSSGTLNYSHR